jgi:hypothetical protein
MERRKRRKVQVSFEKWFEKRIREFEEKTAPRTEAELQDKEMYDEMIWLINKED